MRYKYLIPLIAGIVVLLFSCRKQNEAFMPSPVIPPVQIPMVPVTPVSVVLLKEMIIPHLPSPYYHFDYDTAGRFSFASFASGFTMYNIEYNNNKISHMKNTTAGNQDRLQYAYDNTGRVNAIDYVRPDYTVSKRVTLIYDGQQLIKLVRERNDAAGFVIEKTMTFSYQPDGNLKEIIEHYFPSPNNGQVESNFVDRFEQYDGMVNADGFNLLHDEFFDHLVLLPDVKLQKNNPGRLTRTGDGVNYQIDYTYTYNPANAPLTKNGTGIWLNGPDAGQPFPSNAVFTYY